MKKEKEETKNGFEMGEIPHVDLDQDPEKWKQELEKEFSDVPQVMKTLSTQSRINYQTYYYELKKMTEESANDVLRKALTKITGNFITSPSEFVNTALLLIRLSLYPPESLPKVCYYGEEQTEVTLDELIRHVAVYLLSEPVMELLRINHLKLPASIYSYAGEKVVPKDAPTDEDVFPWLVSKIELTPHEKEQLSENKSTLMPRPSSKPPEPATLNDRDEKKYHSLD